MKFYFHYLKNKNLNVEYISHELPLSDVRNLIPHVIKQGYSTIYVIDPVDDWLSKRIKRKSSEFNANLKILDSPMFLLSQKDIEAYHHEFQKAKPHQTSFYIHFRKKFQILIEENSKPVGGKWSYDVQNRKKIPRSIVIPVSKTYTNKEWIQAKALVLDKFHQNPGEILENSYYPLTFDDAQNHLDLFLRFKLHNFGEYQDAISFRDPFLFHSNLSACMNIGLITPKEVIKKTMEFFESKRKIPINSIEGFLRQILGWREFIRYVYVKYGITQRNSNYWNFENRKQIEIFYKRKTNILPVDLVLEKVHKIAYSHHIERLMLLGNLMLLLNIHPEEVYLFFMIHYIDAYDWVMVPNVYGMSQFADGGLMSTKPYFSSSSYIIKMSDSSYKNQDWRIYFDALFWKFLFDHQSKLQTNPRMSILLRHLSSKNENEIQKQVETYIKSVL